VSHLLQPRFRDEKAFIGATAPAVKDAVHMFCSSCGLGKSWVSKEDYEVIKQKKIVFMCELCVALFGTGGLHQAEVCEVDHENEVGHL
jgi:hypothetical protein